MPPWTPPASSGFQRSAAREGGCAERRMRPGTLLGRSGARQAWWWGTGAQRSRGRWRTCGWRRRLEGRPPLEHVARFRLGGSPHRETSARQPNELERIVDRTGTDPRGVRRTIFRGGANGDREVDRAAPMRSHRDGSNARSDWFSPRLDPMATARSTTPPVARFGGQLRHRWRDSSPPAEAAESKYD